MLTSPGLRQYEQPKFFTLAFLALNGTGVIVSTEWMYREVLHRSFDSPAYRAGKALAALAVAIAVVSVFQLVVARNPARRTLRKVMVVSIDVRSFLTTRSLGAGTPDPEQPRVSHSPASIR